MNDTEVEAVLHHELFKIAPDIDPADIDPGADIREEFDIDSMDFLNLVVALAKAFNIDIPEPDYARMSTYDALADYLSEQTNSSG